MSVIQDVLFKDEDKKEVNSNQEVQTEVLFKTEIYEDLEYSEPSIPTPIKPQETSSSVGFENVNRLREVALAPITPVKNNNPDVKTEILFKTGVEDIDFGGNTELKEESLSFQEPIKPEYISEEVLFSSEPKEVINYSLFDNDEQASVVEETSATEACEADESNAYQISFGDFNDINSAFDNKPILSTPKVKVPKKCFAEKILEAEPPLLEWYEELKNTLLSYKKIKSRLSNSADTFNIGRVQLAKLSVSGKSLKLYLNLDLDKLEPRLRCKDASDKKAYEQVPVFLRIRSPRSMKNAKFL